MSARYSVYTKKAGLYEELSSAMGGVAESIKNPVAVQECELVFVDANWPELSLLLARLAEQAAFVVLVAEESGFNEKSIDTTLVDDILLLPIRAVEARSKLRHFTHLAKFKDIRDVNQNIKGLIEKIEDDLKMARAIQRKFIPEKFNVHGFAINHKYLSGLKSGGDYFDVFEFDDRTHVGILMSDSSGYGLSSALMAAMLRMAFRFGRSDVTPPSATIKRIFAEVKIAMKPKEDLSLFYGILNRKTLEMTYASVGNVGFYRNGSRVNSDTGALRREDQFKGEDARVQLMPADRVVFATDGYAQAFKGDDGFSACLSAHTKANPTDLINECSFKVKRELESKDDLPVQDCSIIVMDVERSIIRLAKG